MKVALCVLLLPAVLRSSQAEEYTGDALEVVKCCGAFEMLAGDGLSCVEAPWPRNYTILKRAQKTTPFTHLFKPQPSDAPWVARWLPPGIPSDLVGEVVFGYLYFLKTVSRRPLVWTVEASIIWNERQAEDEGDAYWRRRVVFIGDGHGGVLTPEPRPGYTSVFFGLGGYNAAGKYCVDAAASPLGPFGLIGQPDCAVDGCLLKCCPHMEVASLQKNGSWGCEGDSRVLRWPSNTSFTPHLISQNRDFSRYEETCIESDSVAPRPLRLPPDDARVPHLVRSSRHDFFFSTWRTCVDLELLEDGTLRDTIFYCPESRITRGVYWLLRPLCFVSASLLAVALIAVACNSGMRLKAHGWCLACHASCLLGFNLGQVTYYMTISDQVDAFGFVPPHLRNICGSFALPMYFLLMAANCWLTTLCFNMAWGFRKIQMVRPGDSNDWKRFLIFSAFAWGLPAFMTGMCAYAYEKNDAKRTWFSPSLTETRTCFHEVVHRIDDDALEVVLSSYPSGTALFYYGPVSVLTVANAVCVARALQKIQFLRRGNSVLHREEDKAARGQGPRPKDGDAPRADSTPARTPAGSTVVDVKTVKLYVKMLLMTGTVDIVVEIIGWVTVPFLGSSWAFRRNDNFFLRGHVVAYRATGFAVDCFRAACVVWLAAPDAGYLGTVRQWLGGERAGRTRAGKKQGKGRGK